MILTEKLFEIKVAPLELVPKHEVELCIMYLYFVTFKSRLFTGISAF